MHEFQHAGAVPRTQVHLDEILNFEALKRSKMAGGKIHYMDKISDRRSVPVFRNPFQTHSDEAVARQLLEQ